MMLSDVCLSRTSGLSREQKGLGRPKLAQRQPTSHIIRTPLSWSEVKGQGQQVALLTTAFTHQAAAAVTVGTHSPWKPTATLRSGAVGSAARGTSAPTEGGEGGGILWRLPHSLLLLLLNVHVRFHSSRRHMVVIKFTRLFGRCVEA